MINKNHLIEKILQSLSLELTETIEAANNAHLAATDDQSVAETQYDTLAIEASYLAEGQSRRIDEIKASILSYQRLNIAQFGENDKTALCALVQLAEDVKDQHWFLIGPAAGGFRCEINGQSITVITPQSPMGAALINKVVDDEVTLTLGHQTLEDTIVNIA